MQRVRPPPPPPASYRLGGIVRYDRRPPPGPFGIRRLIWKFLVRVDAHLTFAMLEWWEALIIALIVLPISGVFLFSAINYFPGHFRYITQRFAYYVFGDESIDILAAWRDAIAGWLAGLHIWAVGALGSGSPRAAPVAVKGEL